MCELLIAAWPCGHCQTTYAYCGSARPVGFPRLGKKREKTPCDAVRSVPAAGDLNENCPRHCLQEPWRCCRCAAGGAVENKQVAWRCARCQHVRCYRPLEPTLGLDVCVTWRMCQCTKCICIKTLTALTPRCDRCVEKCST